MGNFGTRLSRPFKNWNVESRAHKLLSKDTIRPPPTFKSVEKQKKLVDKMYPDYKKIAETKSTQLDEYLKQVFVTSNATEVKEIDSRYNPEKPLPQEKTLPEPFEFGFYEPDVPKPGKLTLRQAIEVLNKRGRDPEKHTIEDLAKEYQMDPKALDDILEYFKIYQIVDIQFNHDRDAIARPMRISMKTGLTIPHTVGKKKKVERPEEMVRYWKKTKEEEEAEEEEKNKAKRLEEEKLSDVKKIKDK